MSIVAAALNMIGTKVCIGIFENGWAQHLDCVCQCGYTFLDKCIDPVWIMFVWWVHMYLFGLCRLYISNLWHGCNHSSYMNAIAIVSFHYTKRRSDRYKLARNRYTFAKRHNHQHVCLNDWCSLLLIRVHIECHVTWEGWGAQSQNRFVFVPSLCVCLLPQCSSIAAQIIIL